MFAIFHSDRGSKKINGPLAVGSNATNPAMLRESDRIWEGVVVGIVVYEKRCVLLKVKVRN